MSDEINHDAEVKGRRVAGSDFLINMHSNFTLSQAVLCRSNAVVECFLLVTETNV